MKYKFSEEKLGAGFAKNLVDKIEQLVKNSDCFTLSGMPGVGGSIFLRYLSLQKFANFIYIDTYQLTDINPFNYYQLILRELGEEDIPSVEQQIIEKCRLKLKELTQKDKRVVIILNRFDQLKDYFSNQLFNDLISLRNVDLEKVVFIFTANKPFPEILPPDITGDKVNLLATIVNIKPYQVTDLAKLLRITGNITLHNEQFIKRAFELSGGHYQLLQLLLKSERLEPPFIDQFVKYQLRELYAYLNYNQKKIVKKIAQGKQIAEIDPYLINIGMVNEVGESYQLFSPLLTHFLIQENSTRMTDKERKLFRLLKQHLGKTVLKEEIFEYVWDENLEDASDWALTSLIYRLRKHPQVIALNLIIESHKKVGYIMLKS